MPKNRMLEVAKEIGVDVDEEFILEEHFVEVYAKAKINKDGMFFLNERTGEWHMATDGNVIDVLMGMYHVVKAGDKEKNRRDGDD
jgi:hypothetical protein